MPVIICSSDNKSNIWAKEVTGLTGSKFSGDYLEKIHLGDSIVYNISKDGRFMVSTDNKVRYIKITNDHIDEMDRKDMFADVIVESCTHNGAVYTINKDGIKLTNTKPSQTEVDEKQPNAEHREILSHHKYVTFRSRAASLYKKHNDERKSRINRLYKAILSHVKTFARLKGNMSKTRIPLISNNSQKRIDICIMPEGDSSDIYIVAKHHLEYEILYKFQELRRTSDSDEIASQTVSIKCMQYFSSSRCD